MAEAARRSGRSPEDVRLVAVTKTVGIEEIRILHDLGETDLGENRLEIATPKIQAFGRAVTWHMIGNVQRRKARDIVALFDCVDAVDRLSLAEALDKRCADQGKRLDVLLEVNVSGEESKHGLNPADLDSAVDAIGRLERLRIRGLLTMAPFVADPEETRPVFAALRELAERFGFPGLSMGMTNDFEVAIEEGATQVRIGSALFRQ